MTPTDHKAIADLVVAQLLPVLTGQLSISVEPAPPASGSFAQRLADCMATPKRKSPQRRMQP